MTLQEYQDYLHSLYQGDGSTPGSTSDEWDHRTNILAAAIGTWDHESGVFWNELWSQLADAGDGDTTVVAATLTYDMPTDFRFLGSYVRTTTSGGNNTYYRVITPSDAELYTNTSVNACYVTGNASAGFDLTFLKQPTAGDTINYPYYKSPTVPSATTDVIEMSDPWFAVYFGLSKLHEHDRDGDRATEAMVMAQDKLRGMKVQNMMLPHEQTNKVKDRDFGAGFGGFGSQGAWGVSRYGDML